jgi:endonuclease/exonuclease/phosphatase family metal-dependent hydrolase
MRVATFNILHGAVPGRERVDPGLLAESIASLDADVVGLQEVDHHQPRSGGVDLTVVAARAMGARAHRFAAALAGTPDALWTAATGREQPDGAGYGVALLSRHPVSDWRVVRLPGAPLPLPHRRPGGWRFTLVRDEARVGLVARVEAPGGPVRVVTTHLSFLHLWNGAQLRRLRRRIGDASAPTLLLGDLNMGPSRAARITGMRSLASAPTFPAHDPTAQIDHVLGSGQLRSTASRVARLPISDHLALVAEVECRPLGGSAR